jgi:hypothetical protein
MKATPQSELSRPGTIVHRDIPARHLREKEIDFSRDFRHLDSRQRNECATVDDSADTLLRDEGG